MRDGGGLFGLEGERKRPDPHFGAGIEDRGLRTGDFDVAHHAAIQADVLQMEFPVLHPHDGVVAGDERTGEHHGVRRIATDGHVRDADLDHGPPAFIDLVEPDFQLRLLLGLRLGGTP